MPDKAIIRSWISRNPGSVPGKLSSQQRLHPRMNERAGKTAFIILVAHSLFFWRLPGWRGRSTETESGLVQHANTLFDVRVTGTGARYMPYISLTNGLDILCEGEGKVRLAHGRWTAACTHRNAPEYFPSRANEGTKRLECRDPVGIEIIACTATRQYHCVANALRSTCLHSLTWRPEHEILPSLVLPSSAHIILIVVIVAEHDSGHLFVYF
jgi:hypothetical protein